MKKLQIEMPDRLAVEGINQLCWYIRYTRNDWKTETELILPEALLCQLIVEMGENLIINKSLTSVTEIPENELQFALDAFGWTKWEKIIDQIDNFKKKKEWKSVLKGL
jgi:hypothetical protein